MGDTTERKGDGKRKLEDGGGQGGIYAMEKRQEAGPIRVVRSGGRQIRQSKHFHAYYVFYTGASEYVHEKEYKFKGFR